jgi:signal transduction histidine kinase
MAAQEAIRTRDEFLSVASHELKTPVTSMLGFSQLILRRVERDGILDIEKARKPLEIIEQQSQKLASLISQLLDISRIEAGKLVLDKTKIDLVELMERVAASVQIGSSERAIALDSPPLLIAEVDPLRLEQVLTNLVDNGKRQGPLVSCQKIPF